MQWAMQRTSGHAERSKDMKILVVEDDMVSGMLLKKLLAKQGHEAIHVVDGEKALAVFKKEPFRIVVTDWMMPNMDGPTLCRHIRQHNSAQYIYVILLTAKVDKADAVAGLEAGADDYIVKPFDKDELMARIRVGQRLTELEDKYRQTSEKLSRSEKMAAVGQLAAGVAHEINNPIGFISSNLKALADYHADLMEIVPTYQELTRTFKRSISQSQLDPKLPKLLKQAAALEGRHDIAFLLEDMAAIVQDCTGGAQRIKNIVHEMRYFAHPDQQQFGSAKMADLAAGALEKIAPLLNGRIDVRQELNDLPAIQCNGEHIKQVLCNIIQNAIDAIETKGTITLSGQVQENFVEVTIADDGKGIPEDHQDKVWNAFFTTKAIGQGVGLGLTTSMNIVKMHKGDISLKSVPGESTAISILLPIV
jgi:two-component system, NtrC family, sensor kinase